MNEDIKRITCTKCGSTTISRTVRVPGEHEERIFVTGGEIFHDDTTIDPSTGFPWQDLWEQSAWRCENGHEIEDEYGDIAELVLEVRSA